MARNRTFNKKVPFLREKNPEGNVVARNRTFNKKGALILDPGSWIQDPGSWILDPGSKIQDPGFWIYYLLLRHGARAIVGSDRYTEILL